MATQKIGLEAVFDISKFTSAAGTYKSDLSSIEKATLSTSTSISGVGDSFGGLSSLITPVTVAIGALTAGLGALTAGLTASVTEAANFEQSIANIAAVTGKSIEDVGELKDLALDLSIDPNLSVTAGKAAESIEMLAKNGVQAEQILGGVGRGTVVLANATGEDFALAADVATDAMNLFKIEAEDFGGVTDNVTGVLLNSKFGLNDIRLALAQGGAVAASTGQSFDEFAAIIAATASNFASGSDAGTAYKTFIQRLTAPTGKAKDQLAQLGISVFDAEGNMRSMIDIFDQFRNIGDVTVDSGFTIGGRTEEQEAALADYRKQLERVNEETREWELNLSAAAIASTADERVVKMDRLRIETENVTKEIAKLEAIQGEVVTSSRKLTEQEKQQALTTIFGADAIRFATGAMNLQEGQLEALIGKINQEGLAQEAAATRTQTFQGAIERLNSAYEFLKIQIGTPLLAPLTGFLDDTITPGVKLLASFADGITDIQQGGTKLSSLALDLGFGADTVGDLNQISEAFANSYEDGIALAKVKAAQATDKFFNDIFADFDFSAIGAQLSDFAFDFGFSVDTANAIYAIGQAFDEGLLPGLAAVQSFLGGLDVSGGGILAALGFSEETILLVQSLSNQLGSLFSLFATLDFEGLQSFDFGSLFTGFLETIGNIREELITGAGVALGGIVVALQEFGQSEEALSAVDSLTSGIAFVIVEGFSAALADIPGLVNAFGTLATSLLNAAGTIFLVVSAIGGQLVAKIFEGFAEKITGEEFKTLTLSELSSLFTSIGDLSFSQLFQIGVGVAFELVRGLLSGFADYGEFVRGGIFSVGETILTTIKEFFGISSPSTVFAEIGLNLIQGLIQGITENAAAVATALTSTVGAGIASFGDTLSLPDIGLSELFGGGGEQDADGGAGIFEYAKSIKDGLGVAFEETGEIISEAVAPAFEAASDATGLFTDEAQQTSTFMSGQLAPALSRISSELQTGVSPSLEKAANKLDLNTQEATKLARVLDNTLNKSSAVFAEMLAMIAGNAEDAIEPLTEVKNLLGEIAVFLQAIQAVGGGSSASQATASAVGGAQTGALGTGGGVFQSFSSVRNNTTSNNFNLTVNSSQPSKGIIGDFGRLQALV